jgi:hypothetical protein
MAITSTQAFTFRLLAGDNNTQLDLFNDEDIQLSNNVTGLFDIGLQPADFTRQITIPGTKTNNAFFEHYYDISIVDPFLFSTNTKVPAFFEFDSLYLSNGYIQLNKVNLIANKFIESYEITMYGTISSFGRDINNLFLTNLTSLQKYNHTSSYDNIAASWSGSLFGGDIVYPLADYGNGWAFTPSNPYTGIDSNMGSMTVQDFKPGIRVKKVWDAIFEQTGYTYSSSFWNEAWLDDVYMICNNKLKYPIYSNVDLENLGLTRISAISGSGTTNITIPQETITNLPWYNVERDPSNVVGNNSSYTITLDHSSSLELILNLDINLSGSLGAPTVEFIVRDTGSLATKSLTTLPAISNYFYDSTMAQFAAGNTGQNETSEVQIQTRTGALAPGTYYFALQWRDQFTAPYNNFTFKLDPSGAPKSYLEITRVNQAADGRVLDIPLNMPYGTTGIKLVDFITGLQRKFNLVMYPDRTKPNHFIVEEFNTWYKRGERKDFNQYINLNEKIEVTPANNLAVNNLNFGDKLDTDYISQQFFKGANREYGKSYYIDTQNFFSQGTLNVETTFASSPLLQIVGTGLSGSVSGATPETPTQFFVGECRYAFSYDVTSTCTSPARVMTYTTSGELTPGLIAYSDRYGVSPILGLTYVTGQYGGAIYSMNSSTGEIGSETGYYCSF